MKRKTRRLLKIALLVFGVTLGAYYLKFYSENQNTKHDQSPSDFDFDTYNANQREENKENNDVNINKAYNAIHGKLKAFGKKALPFSWENRQIHDFEYPQFQAHRLGNYEETVPKQKRAGAGEYGEEVKLDASLKKAVDESIQEFGFNIVASDRVSLDRAPKDLRADECKHWDYPTVLAKISVIMVFHNEAWSPVMRTVHNVINYSPKEYLHEIVLVDDGSQKAHWGERLETYITQFNGLVKLFRNARREGLIRARSIGAKKSTGEILVYLDAHCEAEPNWLPPLVTPILNDYRTCTVPLIDAIDGSKYTFTEQAGGDSDGFARGAWDWALNWKRIPLPKKEKAHRIHKTENYRSPAMAGGLFAIHRDWFFELGLYDDGLEIWGGENFELSYKIWMCGGQLLFVPCSRVGHLYRMPGWRGNPPPSYVPHNSVWRNYRRVIDTWWDDYAKYFYMRRPTVKNIEPGDLTEQKAIRTKLKCRSFSWFMKEIAYDVPVHYPVVEPPPGASGTLLNIGTNLCLDGGFGGSGSPIKISSCSQDSSEMRWWLTWHEDVRPGGTSQNDARSVCLDSVSRDSVVTLWECHTMHGNQLFKYIYDRKQLYHSITGSCLEASPGEGKVYARECNYNKNQMWTWEKLNITQLAIYNTNIREPTYVIDI